jgi:flagellar biogenesis protein FliO
MSYDTEFLSAALKMGLALAVVLAMIWSMSRLLKGRLAQGRGQGGPLLQIRGTLPLGLKKQVALVEVPGAVLVLGITQDRIATLDRIVDAELIESIKAGNSGQEPNFKSFLRSTGKGLQSADHRSQFRAQQTKERP